MSDTKLTELEADASLTGTELVYLVDDPSGTPASKKTTVADIKTFIGVPVKATGAEVDTGTDDAKFVTAKAMEDSAYIKTVQGTAVLSTGEAGGTKYLREDGDGTCSWQAVSAAVTLPTKSIRYVQLNGVTPNGTYSFSTADIIGTIANVRWTSSILPVGSSRTLDIRLNGTASTDSIFTSDTPIAIAVDTGATNGKYTVEGAVIDNGVLAENSVLYFVLAGGSTSGTADDFISIEIA